MNTAPLPKLRPKVGEGIPGYGVGVTTIIAASEAMRLDPDVLAARLLALFESPNYQPPLLPAAALEITRLAHAPTVEVKDIVEVLGTDPLLAGRVMVVAQSPAYGGSVHLKSLQEAVHRLGFRGLRNIVLTAALEMRVFRTPIYAEQMESIRRHSLVTAHLSHLIGRMVGVDPNEAFLAGLLHDVGLAGGLLAVADGHRKDAAPPLARYWSAIDRAHGVGGGAVLRHWGLLGEIVEAVTCTHTPFQNKRLIPLAGCVALGEHLAARLGAAVHHEGPPERAPTDTTDATTLLAVRDAFSLTPAKVLQLDTAAKALYPHIG